VHATKRSQLVLPLAIAAAFGASTLPVLAQDDAAASAATEGGADRAKLAESATLFVHNVMIAKPKPAVAAGLSCAGHPGSTATGSDRIPGACSH
jgi:hypothetical protein